MTKEKEITVVHAYDAADQLTTNAATIQGYNAAGQLTTAVTGTTSTAYLFDARGNRTKATTGTTVTNYGYDQANRLTSYSKGTTTASYAYNGDGLRASKTTGGTTKKFVYNTAQGMPLILNDGASSYLYGPGGVPFEQITTAGVATYLHPDQLGSIRMITNTTGTNAGTASYTAYGTRTTTGTTSPFGYAGQYTDTETGLQWLRARYYDPTTAQFLTVDPLAAATGARYSYASGNPITGADPTGLIDWGQVFVVTAGVAAIIGTGLCVIAEPCGAIEGGLGLAFAGGSTVALTVTVSAEAAATATTAAIAGGGIFGSLDIMMQNAASGSDSGSDCADQEALDYASTSSKLDHIFAAKHNFDPLVQQLGSREAVVQQFLNGLKGLTPASGTFEQQIVVGGQKVIVSGAVVDGITKIGTAFTP